MSLSGNKDVRFIIAAVSFLMCVVTIAMIIDFKIIDVVYMACCVLYLARFLYLRITL